jgi:hypothetical protein
LTLALVIVSSGLVLLNQPAIANTPAPWFSDELRVEAAR